MSLLIVFSGQHDPHKGCVAALPEQPDKLMKYARHSPSQFGFTQVNPALLLRCAVRELARRQMGRM